MVLFDKILTSLNQSVSYLTFLQILLILFTARFIG